MPEDDPMFLTPRLLVRGFRPSDLDVFAALCADSDVMKYCGDGTTLDRDTVAQWIETCQSRYRERGYGTSAVFERETGAFVGYCGVVCPEGQTFSELIYVLHRSAWGKGYATEVSGPMLDYVFARSELDEIWATIDVRNPTSINVAHKLGMSFVPRVEEPDGTPIGHYVRQRQTGQDAG